MPHDPRLEQSELSLRLRACHARDDVLAAVRHGVREDLDADGVGDIPFRPNDGVDVLLWKYPSARNLMSSPSVLLLRYVQRAFPVFTPPSVQDSHPLMKATPATP